MKALKTVCCLILMIGLVSYVFAEQTKRSAKIVSIDGEATVKTADEKGWVPAEEGMVLNEGDTIKTKSDSWVLIEIGEGDEAASVEIEESSQLLLSRLEKNVEDRTTRTLLDLPIGEILIKVEKLPAESKFEVKTPESVAGVRGTRFGVRVEALE